MGDDKKRVSRKIRLRPKELCEQLQRYRKFRLVHYYSPGKRIDFWAQGAYLEKREEVFQGIQMQKKRQELLHLFL